MPEITPDPAAEIERLKAEHAAFREKAMVLAGRWRQISRTTDATLADIEPGQGLLFIRAERARVLRRAASDLDTLLATGRLPRPFTTSAAPTEGFADTANGDTP